MHGGRGCDGICSLLKKIQHLLTHEAWEHTHTHPHTPIHKLLSGEMKRRKEAEGKESVKQVKSATSSLLFLRAPQFFPLISFPLSIFLPLLHAFFLHFPFTLPNLPPALEVGGGGTRWIKIHANLPNRTENWREIEIFPLEIFFSLSLSFCLFTPVPVFTQIGFLFPSDLFTSPLTYCLCLIFLTHTKHRYLPL